MPLNMTKLNELAMEWDPGPFLEAIEQASAIPLDPQPGGAMDMGAGGDFASIMGTAPQAKPGTPAALPPQAMAGLMPQQPQQPQVSAPSVAPRGPGPAMQFPGLPRMAKVPSLRDILGGR